MSRAGAAKPGATGALAKSPSGIRGLDEITFGGLPRARPTLVCGGAGCGKTLLAMEFLVRGALEHGEPGVFVAFEENANELARNVRSLGFDVKDLAARKLLYIDHVVLDRDANTEAGAYSLDGLFVRLDHAINTVKAKRVALDTIETLFAGLSDAGALRAELIRLFRWLKQRGMTAVVTAERGDGTLTRHGLEEYVSDCVISLDQRVSDQVATRRLRVVKYRGSPHGTNEYPFLIDAHGFSVVPLTALGLQHAASTARVSSGVPSLDAMLGGRGYFRGTTVLISGEAGTGKTSLAAHFAAAACRRGERCLYFSFEESPDQIMRNMRSIGLDLRPWRARRQLEIRTARPASYGLETHLATMYKAIADFDPRAVIIDPVSSFDLIGQHADIKATMTCLVDFMKSRGVTALLTNLTPGGQAEKQTEIGISSIVDTWLQVRNLELPGERNRGLYVVKSRGMAHSNQVREFVLTDHGVELLPVSVGADGGILTGSARLALEAQRRAAVLIAAGRNDSTPQPERARRPRKTGHR